MFSTSAFKFTLRRHTAAGEDVVEESADGFETFLATLPLTAATRDVLHAGVEFELFRVGPVKSCSPRHVII